VKLFHSHPLTVSKTAYNTLCLDICDKKQTSYLSIRTASRGRATVSSVESSSMMVLAKWLETFPDDFQDQLMQASYEGDVLMLCMYHL